MSVGFLERISQGKRYPTVDTGSARESQLVALELAIYYHFSDCQVTSQKTAKKSSLSSFNSEILGLLGRCLEGVMASL